MRLKGSLLKMFLMVIGSVFLTGCMEYLPEEKQKVEDLVKSESANFKKQAKDQYGEDVLVLGIKGETYNKDISVIYPKVSIRAGDNLLGHVKVKGEDVVRAIYVVEEREIRTDRAYRDIEESIKKDIESYGVNVLALDVSSSGGSKHLLPDDVNTYKQMIGRGDSIAVKIITDTDLGNFEPTHFWGVYDEMVESGKNGGYYIIDMARVEDNSKENVEEFLGYWKRNGLSFSKHENAYYKGEYVKGDPRLEEYNVIETLYLDDSRGGAMMHTDSKDVRIWTYRTPNEDDGEYSWEVELHKEDDNEESNKNKGEDSENEEVRD